MNNANENKTQKESRGQRIARHYEEMTAKKQLRLLRNEYARFLIKACNGDMAAALKAVLKAYGAEYGTPRVGKEPQAPREEKQNPQNKGYRFIPVTFELV